MCNDCCKAFTGWCKAFTKTEILLCVLQAVLFVVLIAFLTFLILHLVVCVKNKQRLDGPVQTESNVNSTSSTKDPSTIEQTTGVIDENDEVYDNSVESKTTKNIIDVTDLKNITTEHVTQKLEISTHTKAESNQLTTLDKSVKCSWRPSEKTKAWTHYYDISHDYTTPRMFNKTVGEHKDTTIEDIPNELEDFIFLIDSPNGKEVHDSRKDFLLALAKIKPLQEITFGCTLTVVTEFWTLTAASCIQAIEEVDSLELYVMIHWLKEENQKIHPVGDVVIHPYYQGVNLSYDLAALKSENTLVSKGSSVVTLPSLLDYFVITIGETLTILGFGKFRSNSSDPVVGVVRKVRTHCVPAARCGAPAERGAGPLCAGVLRARAAPCRYCAGTPLLRRRVLLGVMSRRARCGAACQPALFVNLPLAADWLHAVVDIQ